MNRHPRTTLGRGRLAYPLFGFVFAIACLAGTAVVAAERPASLSAGFLNPPASARPWVYWFWINGNITKEGITADLEALQRAGVGGVLWMEVSGPWWAPDGDVVPLSPEWHEAFQWAVRECARLGMQIDVTLDFGYGSGGPHIGPDRSMQKLVWGETTVEGGGTVDVMLDRPSLPAASNQVSAWLRPGANISETVLRALEASDGYRDVAVVAIPTGGTEEDLRYRIPGVDWKAGLGGRGGPEPALVAPPEDALTPAGKVVDLRGRMDSAGRLRWSAPPGRWLIIRYGQVTNLKMTRPCPAVAVGLECDRLDPLGIETHFDAFLKKIIEGAGPAAGTTLAYAHIDSWEAGGQNWTRSFPEEFRARRGYDPRPWLPVLTGRVVGGPELSERFLWDFRSTADELMREKYADRLRELLEPYGMRLSIEAYGNHCNDSIAYAETSDMPVSEFWAEGEERFPKLRPRLAQTSKVMASAAHTGGKPFVGAEAFTSSRGWQDHPYLLKAMGDWAFCQGVNRLIFHLSAHQPYENAIPGLTHRKWGEHFQRHNTWWEYSRPWIDYLSRCQYLLQQGSFVADVLYLVSEDPLMNVDAMVLDLPTGYDYDICSTETVLQLRVQEGCLVLPSGMRYRYLVLPDTDRMTLTLARKIQELADQGARLIGGERPSSSPSLTDYPQCDAQIADIATSLWDTGRVRSRADLAGLFRADGLMPDFEGQGLRYIHRRVEDADVYFVAHSQETPVQVDCVFRVSGCVPERWDPETGEFQVLPEFRDDGLRTTVPLHFGPMQSCFVVFRTGADRAPSGGKNSAFPVALREIAGPWRLSFDARWGGPDTEVVFDDLSDWSRHADPRIHYYSGTVVYRNDLEFSRAEVDENQGRLLLDLGNVEVMARVRLNGVDCGIAWKPPYAVDITHAVRAGKNELEIDVVNLWINRMIGDEQLPVDAEWQDFETLLAWPEWFKTGTARPSGRYTFTTCRHYSKDTPLVPSGLLGPVTVQRLSGR